ncbi:hypothetical protein F7C95_00425 [Opitutia bacterium ISCC 51]|nr:hypothetical protein F7C95_00425 [Opitutae bacterium ISCC 51]QXD28484.1 hypothetical protein GA003_00420 [Opitutae bacterium ISCC 52]
MSEEAEAKKPKWKLLGQLLGALGVILSLIFVAWEIRQNTEAVKSATIQAISEQSIAVADMMVQNEDLRIAFLLAWNEAALSSDQDAQVTFFYVSLMRLNMNRYLQFKLGILEKETVLYLGMQQGPYHSNHFKTFWSQDKTSWPEDFVEFMETEVMTRRTEQGPLIEALQR